MKQEELIWPDPETEFIESPLKIPTTELAKKWHLRDPNYPTNTHRLNTYTTLLRKKSVSKCWVKRRKEYQLKFNRTRELLPKQKAVLDKAQLINQKHFDALEKALTIYNKIYKAKSDLMETNPYAITPQDLKQLTAAMLDIQKGQRLAVGLATDRTEIITRTEVETAFKQFTNILIFVFDSGKVSQIIRETAMERLKDAIDIGEE